MICLCWQVTVRMNSNAVTVATLQDKVGTNLEARAGNSSWPLANFRPFSTFVRPKLTLAGHYVQAIKK